MAPETLSRSQREHPLSWVQKGGWSERKDRGDHGGSQLLLWGASGGLPSSCWGIIAKIHFLVVYFLLGAQIACSTSVPGSTAYRSTKGGEGQRLPGAGHSWWTGPESQGLRADTSAALQPQDANPALPYTQQHKPVPLLPWLPQPHRD